MAFFCGGINADPHPAWTNHSDNLVAYTHRRSPGDLTAVAAVAYGDLISMSLALIGLGALLAASALAVTALKWLGASI